MELGAYSPELPATSLQGVFEEAHRLGFSRLQYSFSTSHGEELPAVLRPEDLATIRACSRSSGVAIAAVNGTFNMIHPDREYREEYIRRFALLAGACAQLDCALLTLCTGTRNPQHQWSFHPDTAKADAWEDLLGTTARLLEIAERHQVILGVETEASNVVSSVEKTRQYLDRIGSGRLKVIMDCANLFPSGTAAAGNVRPVVQKAFDLLGDDIILAHGKDILEGEDIRFTFPGGGIVDYGFYFSLLKRHGYQGPLILHGVKDPKEFPQCVSRMREALSAAGL